MTFLTPKLLGRSVTALIRGACLLTLSALALMACSILWPRPLPVILAMSAGHLLGAAGLGCYLLGVVLEAARSRRAATIPPPGPRTNVQDHE